MSTAQPGLQKPLLNHRAREVDTGEPEVPGHPQLQAKFEASLGFMESSISKTTTAKRLKFMCIQESLGDLGIYLSSRVFT